MSHRIQMTVDAHLEETIKAKAKTMGLSVSSCARLILKNALSRPSVLDQSLNDIATGDVETLTLETFNREID